MNFVFRVDASNRIGIGHLIRCLTLADSLRARGAQTKFICRDHPGNLILLLGERGFPVTTLPLKESNDSSHNEDYAVWLGATQAEDAEQTINALNGEVPDWLVVDHYGIDADWEGLLRPHVGKIFVIDDLANRAHDCDVLLDQNFSLTAHTRYTHLISNHCRPLLGPRYALLRSEYAEFRKDLLIHDGRVQKVMVFFGGSDPHNMTGVALQALSHPDLKNLDVEIVIGANNVHVASLKKLAKNRGRTTISGSRLHLADLMAYADLAIGAGGTTTWERMCLGLPTVVVSIADNQTPSCEALAEANLVEYLGSSVNLATEQLTLSLLNLLQNSERLLELSERSKIYVDGLGAHRIAEVLMRSEAADVTLRAASEHDIALYFNWVNDPAVRKSALDSNLISWPSHKMWFAKKMADPDCHMLVMEASGLPVGQIRFELDNESWILDYSLDVIARGRGWGGRLIELGVDFIWGVSRLPVRALVKYENQPSRAVFLRQGFAETASASGQEAMFYRDIVSKTV